MIEMEVPTDAVVLAGGRSRRMGHDKAEYPLGTGECLWQYQRRRMAEIVTGKVWVARPYGWVDADADVVSDLIPNSGPLAGIQAVLAVSQAKWLAVLAVDLPRASTGWVWQALRQVRDVAGQPLVVADTDTGMQPLCGFWSTELALSLNRYVDRGGRRVREFLREQGYAVCRLPSTVLMNLNTPDDLRQWLADG